MARLIASFFGSGLLLRRVRGADSGSGTVAGFAALALALLIDPWGGRLLALAVVLILGWWSLQSLDLGSEDPGWVVIDEVAGTLIATLGLGITGAVIAFVVFRIADIKKGLFPGVGPAEQIGGPAGILADDLVAGLYGLAAGWVVQLTIG
ncbi:MAG TPA: phosphatidylglycerophosphatase A [Acidimicrobiia bacterium]|nr:phosphatidylglycerophosphatase A [Acidimicrobiia bacterium]